MITSRCSFSVLWMVLPYLLSGKYIKCHFQGTLCGKRVCIFDTTSFINDVQSIRRFVLRPQTELSKLSCVNKIHWIRRTLYWLSIIYSFIIVPFTSNRRKFLKHIQYNGLTGGFILINQTQLNYNKESISIIKRNRQVFKSMKKSVSTSCCLFRD